MLVNSSNSTFLFFNVSCNADPGADFIYFDTPVLEAFKMSANNNIPL